MTELDKMLDHLRILDNSEVIVRSLQTLSVAIVVLSVHHIIMTTVCGLPNFTISSVAFAVVQVLVGLPFVRLLQYMGMRTRLGLRMRQSTEKRPCKNAVEITVHRGDFERLFERYRRAVENLSTSQPDDPSDVAWFVLVTSAVVSGIWAALQGGFQYVYSIPFGVLILAAIYTSIVGYRSVPLSFDEMINILEYDIINRLSALENAAGEQYEMTARWCKVRGGAFLDEIAFRADVLHDRNPDMIVKYVMRVPQTDHEEFQVGGQLSESIRQQLSEIGRTRISGWSVTYNEAHLVVFRPTHSNMTSRCTGHLDADPQSIQSHAMILGEVLSTILSILHMSV